MRVIELKSGSSIRNGFAALGVGLHDLDIRLKIGIVDEIAVGRAVLRDIHIKVRHQFAAFPAGYLMHRVDAVGHILGLSKAVLITGQHIALGFLCRVVAACGLEIDCEHRAVFRCFNLCVAVVCVLDDGNIAYKGKLKVQV